MQPTFPTALEATPAGAVLDRLYAEAIRIDPVLREQARRQGLATEQQPGFYQAMRQAYMPVTPAFGSLLYILVRQARPRLVVEFGSSFGISTVLLAAALRDNGSGRLISTELDADKAAGAARNLAAAGLDELVEIRVGDALLSLRQLPDEPIGVLLLDGPKQLYLPLLRLLEPHLAAGALIAGDNSDMRGSDPYLAYVRDPANGCACSAIASEALGAYHGHEIVLRR